MLIVGLTAIVFILMIWLGYPVAIRTLGALRRPARTLPPTYWPSVSVILASRDDAESIRARVSDVMAGDYPANILQIIIARDATSYESDSLDPKFLGSAGVVSVIAGDASGGKAATLNAGVRAARNDILVFADTAQRFDRAAIRALVAQLDQPGVGAVSGMLELPDTVHGSLNMAERYWRYERWLRLWEARVHSCVGVTGAIYAMPRRLWEPLPANLILDDLYVPMRLAIQGWRILLTPDARARDVRRFAPAQEYRRKVRTLTGVIQVCVWLPGVLNPVRNPLWLQFTFHKLLRLLTPYLAIVALIGIAWALMSRLLLWDGGVDALVGIAVVCGVLCLVPRVRGMLKEQLAWGIALQGSIVVATIHGFRGKWDVWR